MGLNGCEDKVEGGVKNSSLVFVLSVLGNLVDGCEIQNLRGRTGRIREERKRDRVQFSTLILNYPWEIIEMSGRQLNVWVQNSEGRLGRKETFRLHQ